MQKTCGSAAASKRTSSTRATMQLFQPSDRPWLPDVKHPEKYKTEQKIFPIHQAEREENREKGKVQVRRKVRQRNGNQREQEGQVLSGHFIDDHELRIFR